MFQCSIPWGGGGGWLSPTFTWFKAFEFSHQTLGIILQSYIEARVENDALQLHFPLGNMKYEAKNIFH